MNGNLRQGRSAPGAVPPLPPGNRAARDGPPKSSERSKADPSAGPYVTVKSTVPEIAPAYNIVTVRFPQEEALSRPKSMNDVSTGEEQKSMGGIIPYFYYDIVARLIPGAATLYVLALSGWLPPPSVTSLFSGGGASKSVVVALFLGGAAYAIGVFYEALFFFPFVNRYKWWVSEKAVMSAAEHYDWQNENLRERAKDKKFAYRVWEEFVVRGTYGADMKSLFAHCHRFQAESKLCQHLLPPTILYAGLCLHWCHPVRFSLGLLAFGFLGLASFWRDQRRWMSVFSFGEHEGFLLEMTQDSYSPLDDTSKQRNSRVSGRRSHPTS